MIIIRILFGIATFFIISFVSVLLARIVCAHDTKASKDRFNSMMWFFSTVIASVFVTLWCVLKGIL